jgi:hypothetical protein
MQTIQLNQLKKHKETFFKCKESSNTVYKINHYNHCDKTYSCSNVEDINHEIFIKSNKLVFIGFTH